ncbi:AbrB/MazE/SpoVT family DNA-binding domain-containing protein [Patescibacteria group bacterium]|nr:AbrB/MazE/SpoVT family DNA-binding domain-containing protein [Patescibacteria group bacterium]
MITATLSSRNQITITKAFLEFFAIKSGDKLLIEARDKAIKLQPMGRSVIRSLGGSVTIAKAQKGMSLQKVMRITQKRVAQKLVNEN